MAWSKETQKAPVGEALCVTVELPFHGGRIVRVGIRTARRWVVFGCTEDAEVVAWDTLQAAYREAKK